MLPILLPVNKLVIPNDGLSRDAAIDIIKKAKEVWRAMDVRNESL